MSAKPPAVLCLTKLYHPNISLEGKVCLNILRVGHMSGGQDDGWKPVFTFYTIIMGLLTMFSAANPDGWLAAIRILLPFTELER
jgi:ubiquitin-conjugating enzyme E2 M